MRLGEIKCDVCGNVGFYIAGVDEGDVACRRCDAKKRVGKLEPISNYMTCRGCGRSEYMCTCELRPFR